jgi:dTDP-4-dehydrorhamnose 3,5-epimerase
MIFTPVQLAGAWVLDLERFEDERGFFARTFCRREFEERGLNPEVAQCNTSFNAHRGTLRGMHYQLPSGEAKLVRCTRGAIYDVIIDLRPESSTYGSNFGVKLTDENRRMLYIPERFAHGFLTLTDNTEVFYQMSEFYSADNSRGVRWNDPAFGINWPEEVKVVSERDRSYPNFIL